MTVDRARGCLLGVMVGDALGAAFEGMGPAEVREVARARGWADGAVGGYISAVPMGTYVAGGEVATYREARGVNDVSFVAAGPTSNPSVEAQCARYGCYTDDTNSCLGMAQALVETRGAITAEAAARRCAALFRDNERYRGCPPTAKQLQALVLEGVPPALSGLPPHFPYPGGSFANGGAMRISPLGITHRDADVDALRAAVAAACLATHRHPEAVDFACVQAAAVRYALKAAAFDAARFFADVQAAVPPSSAMAGVVARTQAAFAAHPRGCGTFAEAADAAVAALTTIIAAAPRPGSGMGFQIASVHMCPCVLWCVARYAAEPLKAVQLAIAVGGDTDTTAAMVGGIVGALHGVGWAAGPLTEELENGAHGRDYALRMAEALYALHVM